MKWKAVGGDTETTSEGYPIPSSSQGEKQAPCRYHDTVGNGKVYKNEDREEIVQVGKIRCDIGDVPSEGQLIEVFDIATGALMFKGAVKGVYQAQMSYRINV